MALHTQSLVLHNPLISALGQMRFELHIRPKLDEKKAPNRTNTIVANHHNYAVFEVSHTYSIEFEAME